MHAAGDGVHGRRLRALIVILWRAGLRIQEALDLPEGDLDQRRGSLIVRRGKRGRRRDVGMNDWGWQEPQPWLELRIELPIGPLFCVISGATRGRPWGDRRCPRATSPRQGRGRRAPALRTTSTPARPRRRDSPEGVPLIVIQASSATATSASPPSTSKASITPRSSTRSTPDARQWFLSAHR